MSIFEKLNQINVNEKTEKKNGLTYLSWAWAWGEVKKAFPEANFTIYERNTDYGPVNYFTDGRTCWVKTGLTINGLEHIEELPVMDFRNNSIPLEKVNSTDVNKAIQRSLTKAAARHGLGLYIYAGEDLPECETEPPKPAGDPFTPPKTGKTEVGTVGKIPQTVGQVFESYMNAFMDVFGFSDSQEALKAFNGYRDSLMQSGAIPKNKKMQSVEEVAQTFDAIYKTFKPGDKK